MDCAQVAELLPWLLNGTLGAGESSALRSHLETCPACGQEWDETLRTAAVFGAHLPSAALVDLAWDRRPSDLDPALVEAHLETCVRCRQELELARESRRLEAEPAGPVRPRAALYRVVAPYAGLAAGLIVAFLAGSRWPGRPSDDAASPSTAERRTATERLAAVEAETDGLRAANARLREERDRLAAPDVNLPVLEVFPSTPRRSGAPAENELVLPAGLSRIALVLNVNVPPRRPVDAELRDEHGAVRWRRTGLFPTGLGYTLGIPAGLIPDGRARILLLDQGRTLETYSIRARRAGG